MLMHMKRQRSAPLRNQLVTDLKGYLSNGDCPRSGQLPTEVDLADRFQVSRKTLRAALDVLEDEKLIKRIHGKGTFRTDTRNQLQKIIYHLIPCADYTIRAGMNGRSNIDQVQAGLLRACAGMDCRVVSLPFTRTNVLTDVDYEALNMIEPGAKVLVPGMWYRHGFKFLVERECDVAFLYTQNFSIHFPDDDNYMPYIKNWHHLRQDTSSVSGGGVRELMRRGCERPLLCASYLTHVTNMKLPGYREAGGTLYWDMPPDLTDFEEFKKELWKKYRETDFDSLLLDSIFSFDPDYRYSLARNLGLPEDVQIITMNEYDFCGRMHPRISYITYDYQQICREAVDILLRNSPVREKREYKAVLHNF